MNKRYLSSLKTVKKKDRYNLYYVNVSIIVIKYKHESFISNTVHNNSF